MPELKAEIRDLVDSFVDQLSDLVRQSSVEAAVDALRRGVNGRRSIGPSRKSREGRGSHRRSPKEILRTEAKVVAYVEKNPGKRSEEIRKALNISPTITGDTLRRLVAKKSIKAKGQRRATKYMKA